MKSVVVGRVSEYQVAAVQRAVNEVYGINSNRNPDPLGFTITIPANCGKRTAAEVAAFIDGFVKAKNEVRDDNRRDACHDTAAGERD